MKHSSPKAEYLLEDEEIIALYFARDGQAIDETRKKYENYLFTVAYNILGNKRDCEECLNDAYLHTWQAIPPARPQVLKAFLSTILRRVAVNRYHHNRRKRAVPSEMTVSLSELSGVLTDAENTENSFDAKRLGQILSDFVGTLPKRRKYVFMSRFYGAYPIDRIAKDLQVSRSTVDKELAAIKSALKERLECEGYIL